MPLPSSWQTHFPAIHRTANERAAATVTEGRDLRDRADTLLGDIDELLRSESTSQPTRTAA
jgi:hypothetical protein